MEPKTKQETVLGLLKLLLSRQTDWYKEVTPQLIQLEQNIKFFRNTLNLDSERVEENAEEEVSTCLQPESPSFR